MTAKKMNLGSTRQSVRPARGIMKFWDWLWNSKSIWSWVVLFVIAYFVIQFVFFPVLGMIFSSKLPAVIVESGSMEHYSANYCVQYNANNRCVEMSKDYKICDKTFEKSSFFNLADYWKECGDWYEEKNLSGDQFSEFAFKNGFNTGDIIIVRGMKDGGYEVGDVIVFSIPAQKTPIIHRIVKIEETSDGKIYSTKGDHNGGMGSFDKKILPSQVIGKAVFIIPKLGWAKLAVVELFRGIAG
jgi:hypothetical protein